MKPMIIVNGMATAGKDTFADILNKYVKVYKYSAIDKVKEIAKMCGWSGVKDETSRAFLSELKMLTSKYFDMSFIDTVEKYEEFCNNPTAEKVMVLFIREPEDIARTKARCDAITVLIKNDRVPKLTSNYGDAHVEEYEYDYQIMNNGTLEDFEIEICKFYVKVVKPLLK